MAAGITGPEYRRTRTILRWITGGVLVAALAAGWFGLTALRGEGDPWDTLFSEWELLRADWQPAAGEGPLPWTLNVARLLLPIAGTAFLALLTVDVATLLRSLSRNHVIVVGRGVAATTMAARLRRNGSGSGAKRKVYEVESGDEGSLRASGLRRAGMLVVCGDDGNDAATNVATTRTAIGVARRRGFTAHVLVGDPGLALALRARRLVQPDNDRRHVRVANLEELAARQHMRQSTFDDQANPHLLVVGASTFGRAVIVEYARRRWAAGATGERAPVTLVGPRARRAVREIVDRWPFVARVCELRPVAKPLELAMIELTERPYRSYFCDDDEVRALSGALTAATRWRPGQGSIVVRLRRLNAAADAPQDLFDDLGGALDIVSTFDAAAGELLLEDDPVLAFAKGIHQSYLDDAARRGEQLMSGPYLVPWDLLPADAKQANLAQARDFPLKLSLIRCTVAPRTRLAEPFFFRPGEVEVLARGEHNQWVAERLSKGWQHGPVRDYKKRVHPLLVPWEKLPDLDRARNRAIVRNVPLQFDRVLERDGLQIVRLAVRPEDEPAEARVVVEFTDAQIEELGRLIHEGYLARQLARGLAMGSREAMVDWDALRPDLRDSNRAQARDIGRKLDLIEASVSTTPPVVPFAFTPDEVEMLSRYEHDRWVSERVSAGWTYGPRNDAERRHDLLVPWLYLDDAKQDVDRVVVGAIPSLLAAMGLFIHR